MTEYTAILRRHLVLIVVAGLVAGAATAAYIYRQPTRYDATASVQIYNLSSPLQTSGGQSDLTRAMLTQIAIVHGDDVRAAVHAALGVSPSVRVQPAGDADVLNITARASSPARAEAIANAYAQAYVNVGRQRSQDLSNQIAQTLTAQEADLQAQIDALDVRLRNQPSPALQAQRRVLAAQLGGLLASGGEASLRSAAVSLEASIIQAARSTGRPAGPSRVAVTAAAVAIGVLLAFALACAIESVRRRRRSPRRSTLPYVPIFGPVPARRLHPFERGPSRPLRKLLEELTRSEALADSVVQVMGTAPSDSVAAVAVELALSLSENGSSVVVADCDFIRPQLHQLCELPRSPGTTDVLARRVRVVDAVHAYSCAGNELRILSAGSVERRPVPAAALQELAAEVLSTYDVLVLVTSSGETGNGSPSLSGGRWATVVVSDTGPAGVDNTRATLESLRGRVDVTAVVRVEGRPSQVHRRTKANGQGELPAPAELHD